jgi:hypothetical protein
VIQRQRLFPYAKAHPSPNRPAYSLSQPDGSSQNGRKAADCRQRLSTQNYRHKRQFKKPAAQEKTMNNNMIPLWIPQADYEQLQRLAVTVRDLAGQAETTTDLTLVALDEARAEAEAEIAAIVLGALAHQPE